MDELLLSLFVVLGLYAGLVLLTGGHQRGASDHSVMQLRQMELIAQDTEQQMAERIQDALQQADDFTTWR